MVLKILVADDEVSVREVLTALLSEFLPTAEIEEASDGNSALALATSREFDVVFLDIEMPGLSGLEVASRLLGLKRPPRVVFATGKAGHALEAFRLAAFDYVMKPFDPDRLRETVERLLAEVDPHARQRESIGQVYEHHEMPKLWAEVAEDSWILLGFEEIYWLEAAGRQVSVYTPEHKALTVKQSLKEIELRLSPHGFIRVHKGYLVNASKVSKMKAWFSGAFILVMSDEKATEIPLSRRYANDFKRVTGWS